MKFRQASHHFKRIPEAANLAYANITKEAIPSQKLGSCEFRGIANIVLNKNISVILTLFNGTEVLSSASDKEKLLQKTCQRTKS